MTTPRDAGFRMPAEWGAHAATWVAWPSHEDLWQENIATARAAFVQLALAISSGETVHVLVPDEAAESLARAALARARNVRFHRIPFGDIWLRDTAPIFLKDEQGALATVRFSFNGWGGKYVLDHDDQVAERIASTTGLTHFARSFVLEGGAVDVDGEGSVLTTRQCMLNPNRNGPIDAAGVEEELRASLGIDAVLWLGTGLLHDHTDGHVDTIVRFVQPGVVVAMEPRTGDDPNRDVLHELLHDAASLRDARGRKLEVVRIPSPGRVLDGEDRVMPASYVNFYLTNSSVVVPTYGAPWDDEAVERIGGLFPSRKSVGVDARAILTGGGAFHCITQQEPQARP